MINETLLINFVEFEFVEIRPSNINIKLLAINSKSGTHVEEYYNLGLFKIEKCKMEFLEFNLECFNIIDFYQRKDGGNYIFEIYSGTETIKIICGDYKMTKI